MYSLGQEGETWRPLYYPTSLLFGTQRKTFTNALLTIIAIHDASCSKLRFILSRLLTSHVRDGTFLITRTVCPADSCTSATRTPTSPSHKHPPTYEEDFSLSMWGRVRRSGSSHTMLPWNRVRALRERHSSAEQSPRWPRPPPQHSTTTMMMMTSGVGGMEEGCRTVCEI